MTARRLGHLRCDAADRWRIAQRGAPSPRAYLRLVDRWTAAYLRWAYRTAREAAAEVGIDPDRELAPGDFELLSRTLARKLGRGAPPEAPDADQVRSVGRPAMRQAVRAELRELEALGMPRAFLVAKSLASTPDPESIRQLTRTDVVDVGFDLGEPGGPTRGMDIITAGPGERVLTEWADEGRSLIRTLARETTERLPRLVVEAASKGRRWTDLVGEIQRMGAKTTSHARLIARDQVAKLNGRLTQELQTEAGVDRFRLRTSEDERVRDRHLQAARDDIGMGIGVYTWADGIPDFGFYGETGLPGQAGQCRCRAEPVLPEGTREAWAAYA